MAAFSSRFSHVSDIWKGLWWKEEVMKIGLFCSRYSDISGTQAFYQSLLPKFNYVLKAWKYILCNKPPWFIGHICIVIHHTGHISFTWQTVRTRTLILLSGWCNLCEVDGCAWAQNLSSPTRAVHKKPPALRHRVRAAQTFLPAPPRWGFAPTGQQWNAVQCSLPLLINLRDPSQGMQKQVSSHKET